MTTLNSLGTAEPEPAEVADASLAMADYDAKAGDYAAALDWLAVAAQCRVLTPEYRGKKLAWEVALGRCDVARPPLACEQGATRPGQRRRQRALRRRRRAA
jgi:hypothetical protein